MLDQHNLATAAMVEEWENHNWQLKMFEIFEELRVCINEFSRNTTTILGEVETHV